MWETKIFRTRDAMQAWITRNGQRVQWREIFVNNAYGVEFRPLRQPRMPR